METKDYSLTCQEVIDNLLMLADAYEKASAGKAPNGFAFNPTDAAANMKAAVHFIGSFGQQIPQWIPVGELLPEDGVRVLAWDAREESWRIAYLDTTWYMVGFDDDTSICVTHWMPLPEPPPLEAPELTPDAAAALREEFEKLYKGPRPDVEIVRHPRRRT